MSRHVLEAFFLGFIDFNIYIQAEHILRFVKETAYPFIQFYSSFQQHKNYGIGINLFSWHQVLLSVNIFENQHKCILMWIIRF